MTAAIIDEEARQGFLGAIGVVMTGAPVPTLGGDRAPRARRWTVVRLAATLMFADRNRMTGIRRKVPLTSFASAVPRHSSNGDQACNGGSPAHRGGLGRPTSQPERRRGTEGHGEEVISAHRNPASSRATAAATTLLLFLRAAR